MSELCSWWWSDGDRLNDRGSCSTQPLGSPRILTALSFFPARGMRDFGQKISQEFYLRTMLGWPVSASERLAPVSQIFGVTGHTGPWYLWYNGTPWSRSHLCDTLVETIQYTSVFICSVEVMPPWMNEISPKTLAVNSFPINIKDSLYNGNCKNLHIFTGS